MTRVNDLLSDLQAKLSAFRPGRPVDRDAAPTEKTGVAPEQPLESRADASTSPSFSAPSHQTNMDSTPTPTEDAYPPEATAASSSAGDAATVETVSAKLAELEARHADVSDAFLRAKAETENIRRRGEDEMAKARKFAIESFAESLLPVKDSLEAAIALPDATPEQLLEGVHATLRQLAAALERNKVIELNPAASERFDPHRHQAISVVPADQEPNTVVAVLQKGYVIADRVLRPALVTVSAPATH